MKASFFDIVENTLHEDVTSYIRTLVSHDKDSDIARVACTRLLDNFRKRYIGPTFAKSTSPNKRADEAVRLFLIANSECAKQNQLFRVYAPSPVSHRGHVEICGPLVGFHGFVVAVLGEARALLTHWLQRENEVLADLREPLSLGCVGPGSAVGATFNDAYDKLFMSRLTYPSKDLLAIHFENCKTSPTWIMSELVRALRVGYARGECSVPKGVTVPKDNGRDRFIGVPTILGNVYSRGLGMMLESCLCRLGLNITDQQVRNRHFAELGSLDSTVGDPDRPATIDLKSASDSVGWLLTQYLLDDLPNIKSAMALSRDEAISIDKVKIPLNMTSTMGCGFTFPWQTLVFYSIISALAKMDGRGFTSLAVFGDDIIVPEALFDITCRVLSHMNFVVNDKKSFGTGPFKESCGTDWYRGVDIRPVFVETLNTENDCYSLFNRLLMWSSLHDVPLSNTLLRLRREAPDGTFIPLWEDPASGYRVPSWALSIFGKRPVSKTLQKSLRLVDGFIYSLDRPVTISRSIGVKVGERDLDLFDGTICDTPDFQSEVRPSCRQSSRWFRVSNPYGYYLCRINGTVLGPDIPCRSRDVLYRRVWASTPNWDYAPPDDLIWLIAPRRWGYIPVPVDTGWRSDMTDYLTMVVWSS